MKQKYPGDNKKIERMSLVEEGWPKKIRMAYLSIVCSHTVNGVAALHSDLLKKTIFSEFNQLYPGKIQNKTNGVTPRRWIHCCNPKLSELLSDAMGVISNVSAGSCKVRLYNASQVLTDYQFSFIIFA